MDVEKNTTGYFKKFYSGIISENPVFVLILGLCPSLAVTGMVVDGLAMGLAVIFVILSSGIIISLLKSFIPERIKLLSNILIISILVTIVDLVLKAFVPYLTNSLGIFVPLIVVNCIILNNAEFAYKNRLFDTIVDALGKGIGFAFALLIISFFREILSTCQIDFSGLFHNRNAVLFLNDRTSSEIVIKNVFGSNIEIFSGLLIFISASGGFFVLGIIIALVNAIRNKLNKNQG